MTVPTPPNTDDAVPPGLREELADLIHAPFNEESGMWLYDIACNVADDILAIPSVASALTLRQTVIDEPELRDRWLGLSPADRDINIGHDRLLARLRAVVEENPL